MKIDYNARFQQYVYKRSIMQKAFLTIYKQYDWYYKLVVSRLATAWFQLLFLVKELEPKKALYEERSWTSQNLVLRVTPKL